MQTSATSPGLEPAPATRPFAEDLASRAGWTTDDAAPDLKTVSTAASLQSDRTGIFERLVKADEDIAGLIAYSIYKQNKLDWLRAFEVAKGRPPQDAELASYIIGEGTPRRLATYRHLAEATLVGNGPFASGKIEGTTGEPVSVPLRRREGPGRAAIAPGLVLTYGLIAVLFVLGFWLAAHYTMSTR